MEDRTGTVMCEGCADDASQYAIFREATVKEKIENRR
jgi:hypothetical protein